MGYEYSDTGGGGGSSELAGYTGDIGGRWVTLVDTTGFPEQALTLNNTDFLNITFPNFKLVEGASASRFRIEIDTIDPGASGLYVNEGRSGLGLTLEARARPSVTDVEVTLF
jgi:hypothetical protein